jgi:hypothetical protein
MISKYADQKIIPFFKIPYQLLDNKYFSSWVGTAEFKVWLRMYRFIIRGNMVSNLNKKLYKDYYDKGKLVMSSELKAISDFLGLGSTSTVAKAVKDLINKDIIKVHNIAWQSRSKKVYELGYHSNDIYKTENLYMVEYFIKLNADNELADKYLDVVEDN